MSATRPVPIVTSTPLEQRVAALEARIAALEGRQRAKDERHEAALIAIATSVRHRSFTARSLVVHAVAVDPDLRAALAAAGVDTPRKLGRWLRSLNGRPVASLVVKRIGVGEDGAIWSF